MANITDFTTQLPGKLSEDRLQYEFPTINSKSASTGRESRWEAVVKIASGVVKGDEENDKNEIFHEIEDKYFHSQNKLPDGWYGWIKINSYPTAASTTPRKSKPTRVFAPKKIGTKAETNKFTQALRDAFGKYNTQMRKSQKDVEISAANSVDILPPQLADGNAKVESVDFSAGENVYIQRKYDGVRAISVLSNGKPLVYSRTRKEFKGLSHLHNDITAVAKFLEKNISGNVYLDGELYIHGVSLQDISGAVRKDDDTSAIKVEYHIYDCFTTTGEVKVDEKTYKGNEIPFSTRLEWVKSAAEEFPDLQYIKFAETEQINSLEEAQEFYKIFLAEGYEGAIVRLDRGYKYSASGYKSRNLIKMKPVLDDEFEIIGYDRAEKGKAAGSLRLRLKTKDSKEFTVSNFGGITEPDRKKMYDEMSEKVKAEDGSEVTKFERDFKGKFITILFDDWSKDGIPMRLRTNGIIIRDYE